MMMHNGPSGVLSSRDSLIDLIDSRSNNPMVKQHLSDSQEYHHHQQQQQQQQHYYSHPHSDSSRSSSICSTSLSPKTSSPSTAVAAISSTISVPTTTTTTALNDIDPILAQHVEYELGLTKKSNTGTGSGTRKNAWGNLSYAELIAKAIASSAEQRLTLSEIYDWMIKYVPFFRNKVDRLSSAGWKNSIRHNLSLHNRFKRVQSEGTGKSSWWMLNPDDKGTTSNGTTTTTTSSSSSSASSSVSNGVKQVRRRLGPTGKSSVLSSTNSAPKRLRTQRSTKASRALTTVEQQQQQQYHRNSLNQDIPSSEMSIASVYEAQPWASQLENENVANHLYDQELYVTSVNTPSSKTNGNSTGCIQSTYPYDDMTPNYIASISSTNRTNNNNTNNTGDYSYHQTHHFHPHHSHTLYQHHHHGSNYETNSPSSGYYHHPPHHQSDPCTFPIDTYHRTNPNNYSLQQQQQQQQPMDPNDEHVYLNVHSASSHSSTSSHSPPTLSMNNNNNNSNLLPACSSGSTNYLHTHKSLSTGGYLHPTSNESLTLYSHHHHQHLSRHPHMQHPDIEAILQLSADDDDINDDDDDFSTLVHHHHSMTDDQEQFSSFLPNNNHNHQLHSYHDASSSILRTVLKRPIVDVYNQQV